MSLPLLKSFFELTPIPLTDLAILVGVVAAWTAVAHAARRTVAYRLIPRLARALRRSP